MKQSDKKVSFDDPQNGGHFSCRKPVSHVGTSTTRTSDDMAIDPPDTEADISMSSEAARSATGMDVDSADPAEPLR